MDGVSVGMRRVGVLLIACAAQLSVQVLARPCEDLRLLHDRARAELSARAHILRDAIAQGLPPAFDNAVDRTELADLFFNAFTFTAQKTWGVFEEDCTTFVSTGDIPQMWLRDSSVQMVAYVSPTLSPYLPSTMDVVESVLLRQIRFFAESPYDSAFFREASDGPSKTECPPTPACLDCTCHECSPECSPYTYQHDFELDSPLFVFRLLHRYQRAVPERASNFLSACNSDVRKAVDALIELLRVEQNHFRDSPYYYRPLPQGDFAEGIGLVWSYARPSDDQVELGYNIPQNLMVVYTLLHLEELNESLWKDDELGQTLRDLRSTIIDGIHTHGILQDSDGSHVFAYEVDGRGNTAGALLDDANMPNLLWLPLLEFPDSLFPENIYDNTRKELLSSKNTNWFVENNGYGEGTHHGLGSEHESHGLHPAFPAADCQSGCIWHLGLIVQGMTAATTSEKEDCLRQIMETAWHGLLHEGFDPNFPEEYNRDYFGWANALFVEWILSEHVPDMEQDKNWISANLRGRRWHVNTLFPYSEVKPTTSAVDDSR